MPPFTPSAGETGWADTDESSPHGTRSLAAVLHDTLGWPIQIGRQAD